MDEGRIIHPAAGTVDGRRGDHVLIAPPFIVEDTEVTDLFARPGPALDRTLAAP
jgi:hypothetical protein